MRVSPRTERNKAVDLVKFDSLCKSWNPRMLLGDCCITLSCINGFGPRTVVISKQGADHKIYFQLMAARPFRSGVRSMVYPLTFLVVLSSVLYPTLPVPGSVPGQHWTARNGCKMVFTKSSPSAVLLIRPMRNGKRPFLISLL